ncbi:MAG: hypothetical protein M3Z05_01620 [Gemmatimonadota bacterium]|nr:hypothetical protein [Gemmatimonadota bacterium]
MTLKNLASLLTTTLLLTAATGTQERHTNGRWVMLGVPISYVFSGDSVEMVMYPPQAPLMTYRVRRDSIETDAAGNRRVQAFSVLGDTLRLSFGNRVVVYRRVGANGAAVRALTGTWHSVDGRGVSVLTFRSDGQLVLEIEAPAQMRLHGDTLDTMAGGQSLRSILQRTGDTLTILPFSGDVLPAGAMPQKIVRRPWSCFGIAELDRSATECR